MKFLDGVWLSTCRSQVILQRQTDRQTNNIETKHYLVSRVINQYSWMWLALMKLKHDVKSFKTTF